MKRSLLKDIGLPIKINDYTGTIPLPRYLVQGRKIYTGQYEKFRFVIIELSEGPKDSRVAASELGKYQTAFDTYAAFSFSTMSRTQRNAYVRHGIPFICETAQVYLPFLGILFSDIFPEIRRINAEKMTGITQSIFLFLLYNEKRKYAKSDIAKALGINPTYVTRASEQLKAMGLTDEQKNGKNVFLIRRYDGFEFFEKAKEFLINPVREYKYIKAEEAEDSFPVSGGSAVSVMSMLNPPKIQVRACYVKEPDYNKLKEAEEPQWQPAEKVCLLEAWKYDPCKFAVNGIVDPVSLYCSLSENTDERLQKEIETILEEFKWL